ncbi:MAG: hypothetical protein MHM6MM_004808 [Cercozoa sp. M6MM]
MRRLVRAAARRQRVVRASRGLASVGVRRAAADLQLRYAAPALAATNDADDPVRQGHDAPATSREVLELAQRHVAEGASMKRWLASLLAHQIRGLALQRVRKYGEMRVESLLGDLERGRLDDSCVVPYLRQSLLRAMASPTSASASASASTTTADGVGRRNFFVRLAARALMALVERDEVDVLSSPVATITRAVQQWMQGDDSTESDSDALDELDRDGGSVRALIDRVLPVLLASLYLDYDSGLLPERRDWLPHAHNEPRASVLKRKFASFCEQVQLECEVAQSSVDEYEQLMQGEWRNAAVFHHDGVSLSLRWAPGIMRQLERVLSDTPRDGSSRHHAAQLLQAIDPHAATTLAVTTVCNLFFRAKTASFDFHVGSLGRTLSVHRVCVAIGNALLQERRVQLALRHEKRKQQAGGDSEQAEHASRSAKRRRREVELSETLSLSREQRLRLERAHRRRCPKSASQSHSQHAAVASLANDGEDGEVSLLDTMILRDDVQRQAVTAALGRLMLDIIVETARVPEIGVPTGELQDWLRESARVAYLRQSEGGSAKLQGHDAAEASLSFASALEVHSLESLCAADGDTASACDSEREQLEQTVSIITAAASGAVTDEEAAQGRPAATTTTSPSSKEFIQATPAFWRFLEAVDGRSLSSVEPAFAPMVCPPRPWTSPRDGAYLTLNSEMMRFKTPFEQSSALESATDDCDEVLTALNVLGSTPWRVNRRVLELMRALHHERHEVVGKLPPHASVDPAPLDLAHDERFRESERWYAEPDRERREALRTYRARRLRERNEQLKHVAEMHSLRASFHLMEETALRFRDHERIFLPFSVDFRGRAYPLPLHLNHVGHDLMRGLLCFADARPLGERGLWWLKVHVGALCGDDKASLAERCAWTEAHVDEVFRAADDPLGTDWWKRVENPFQAIAAVFELADALRSPCPEEFEARVPVHQDGSCNGLQHYAALGRDLHGGSLVNLTPSDRPQDVYMGVGYEVRRVVHAHAQDAAHKHHELAKLLDGHIERKVIKQTVMTSVYGVTFIGARDQILRQLRARSDAIGFASDDQCYAAAQYLAKVTLDSIGEVFSNARKIMSWLADVARTVGVSVSCLSVCQCSCVTTPPT